MAINSKHRVICFIGIDGTGKTTQIMSLIADYCSIDNKCRYVWNRYEPFLTKPFNYVGNLFIRAKAKNQSVDVQPIEFGQYAIKRRALSKYHLISIIYQLFLLFDYYVQTMVKVGIPLLTGHTIFCDRYIYDTLVDLAVDFEYSHNQFGNVVSISQRIFLKADIIFLFDLPGNIAYERKPEVPQTLLFARRNKYLDLNDIKLASQIVLVDCNNSIDEIKRYLRAKVSEVLAI